MDSLIQRSLRGRNRFATLRIGSAFFCIAWFGLQTACVCPCAMAQHVEIRASTGEQEIVHDLRNTDQPFREVLWDVHNSQLRQGVAVLWTIEPFESRTGRSRSQADASLSLRLQHAVPRNTWSVTDASDRTSLLRKKTTAAVSAVSSRTGEATFGVLVMFHHASGNLPPAGSYHAQLTGTISAP